MATFHIQQDPREKENVVISKNPGKHHQPLLQKNHHNRQDQHKEKRPTLAVLSNVEHVARGHQGKLMVQNKKSTTVTGGYIEKHAFTSSNHNQQQKKILQVAATAKVTTEQTTSTKSFVVYEDIQQNLSTVAVQSNNAAKAVTTTNTNVIAAKTVSISNDKPSTLLADHVVSAKASNNSNTDILPHAIRDPLKEVKTNDGITETPMSVSDILSPMSVDKSISLQNADLENVAPVEQKSRKYSERLFDVCEYQEDILEYYREIEKNHRPKPGYMKRQPDINNSMRTILIDWLVEVAEEYRLHTETLYLSVSYIDRFLSFMSVVRAKLQLVGTAAMFIAAKYEEIYPPDVGEFVFITDDTYSKSQVLKMEQIILKILKFDLNAPSAPVFLDIFSVMHNIPDQVKFLAKYLSELTLLEDEPFLHYLPSQISSASLSLARYILNLPIWCEELEKITKYSLDDLKEIILNLCRMHMESSKKTQQAIPEKYKSHKYMGVSTIKPVELEEEQLDYLIKEYNNSKTKKIVEGSNNELV